MRKISCLLSAVLASVAGTAQDAPNLTWRDGRELVVEGQAFTDTEAPWDRLPARAQGHVRAPVWSLSKHSAGIGVRFVTDAEHIEARWTLTSERLAMPHMPATGVSGLDLYVRHEGAWRWLGCPRPVGVSNRARLASGLARSRREYLCYLPLYNGVRSLEIGVPPDRILEPGPARTLAAQRPLVFYGTSITQGGCASRPGMTHAAILGRRFDRPAVNLGFSGNGRMDLELADLCAEIEAAVYVVDCLPNMTGDLVAERAAAFVRRLRKRRPKTPILLVEDRTYGHAFLVPSARARHEQSRAALRAAYESLQQAGVTDLHYLEGEGLLGADGNATVDGSHPTDLGFVRQANAFEPALRRILSSVGENR